MTCILGRWCPARWRWNHPCRRTRDSHRKVHINCSHFNHRYLLRGGGTWKYRWQCVYKTKLSTDFKLYCKLCLFKRGDMLFLKAEIALIWGSQITNSYLLQCTNYDDDRLSWFLNDSLNQVLYLACISYYTAKQKLKKKPKKRLKTRSQSPKSSLPRCQRKMYVDV